MVIIWGSRHYGKRRAAVVRAACESCGRAGYKRSYEAWHAGHLYFIPIIPMGRQRIFRMCSACDQGRVASGKEWARIRATEIEPRLAAFRDAPTDREVAEEALAVTVGLDDREGFYEVALGIERAFAGDATMLASLGGGYAHFLMDDAALSANRRALDRDASCPEARCGLALALLRAGDPDAAAEHVAAAIKADPEGSAWLGMALVEAYQADGRHRDALAALETVRERCPDVPEEVVAEAESASAGKSEGARRFARDLLQTRNNPALPNAALSFAPLMIAPAIAVVIVAWIVIGGLLAGVPVHLANGLDHDYDVLVGERRVTLVAGGRPSTLTLSPGTVQVAPAPGGAFSFAAFEVPIPVDYVGSTDVVVNPDTTAVFTEHVAHYGRSGDPEMVLHTGRPVFARRGIDVAFRDPPTSIQGGDRGGTRRVLDQALAVPVADLVAALAQYGARGALEAFLETSLARDPENGELLHLISVFLEPERVIALLQAGLDVRPVRVDWHRTWQDVIERTRPDRDLASEYAALANASPGDGALAYLAGRAAPDPDETLRWYEQALTASSPCAYGHLGTAWRLLADAELEAALGHARAAAEAISGPSAQSTLQECLLAAGELDEVAALNARTVREAPGDQVALDRQIELLVRLDRRDELDELVASYLDLFRAGGDSTDALDVARLSVEASIALAERDARKFVLAIGAGPRSATDFELAAIDGRIDDAIQFAAPPEAEQFPNAVAARMRMGRLLLALALALDDGSADLAAAALERSVSALRTAGGHEERRLAKWLETPDATIDPRVVASLAPDVRVAALVALALRAPESRDACLAHARRLAYRHDVVRLALGGLLEDR